MASVIARGTLISPGFSRPSVSWCTLRLQGGRVVWVGEGGRGWGKWPYHNAWQHAWSTHGWSHRHARVCLDLHKDPHPCLSFLTLEASSRRRSQVARMHACTHACLHAMLFLSTLMLLDSCCLCFGEELYHCCTVSYENILAIITTKGIAAVEGSNEPTGTRWAEKAILVADPDYSDVIYLFFSVKP